MTWELVYTVNEYWDGPRVGVADFEGRPYIYKSLFQDSVDENDNETEDVFVLSQITPELLNLVVEDWEIWLRWHASYKKGETGEETHPALPADRSRHIELNGLIGNRLSEEDSNPVKATAKFRNTKSERWSGYEVEWCRIGIL